MWNFPPKVFGIDEQLIIIFTPPAGPPSSLQIHKHHHKFAHLMTQKFSINTGSPSKRQYIRFLFSSFFLNLVYFQTYIIILNETTCDNFFRIIIIWVISTYYDRKKILAIAIWKNHCSSTNIQLNIIRVKSQKTHHEIYRINSDVPCRFENSVLYLYDATTPRCFLKRNFQEVLSYTYKYIYIVLL